MATIRKEITLDAPLIDTWAAFADYHAVDRRIATGFVVKCEPNEGGRTVTFANGIVADEQLVTIDHAAHRLAYARGLDLAAPDVTPIGPACRLCHRHPCAERAAPPVDRPLTVDDWSKSVSPWPFADAAGRG